MMETIAQRQFSQSRLIMAASKFDAPTAYKPGGTAILACNAITSLIQTQTRDRMGRWTSISLSTKSTKRIRIISAYQVCNKPKPGTNTASTQQLAQIIEETSTTLEYQRQSPRQAFIYDLERFITQLQLANEEIILVGDFNESMAESSSGIEQLATNCGLVDLFSIRLGAQNLPATYQRGTRRIDFALVSPSLVSHVKAAGYDPFGYRIPSDHRGMYIDFETEALFQHAINPLAPAEKRDFLSDRSSFSLFVLFAFMPKRKQSDVRHIH
jgi:exonuclease III